MPDAGVVGPPNGPGSPSAGNGARCGALTFTQSITLAPGPAGQRYTRCQTLGPEAGWSTTLSPSGNRIAAVTGAGTVRLIGTDAWSEIVQLGAPLGRIDAVAFSPDGALLATLSSEMGEVSLWSATDGTLRASIPGPPTSGVDTTASALAFSSDGRRLATSLGTIVDVGAGTTSSWLTGAAENFVRVVNPQNLAFESRTGGAVPLLRFAAGDALLFVETNYQVGNSPPSTRLELRDPTTGRQVIALFEMYTRALAGFAVSPDGRYIAVARTEEATVAGFPAGLFIFDATNGVGLVSDPTFTGTVLGFSPDGARLYVETGPSAGGGISIAVRDRADLRAVGEIGWPAGAAFLGVSPAGNLVESTGGATSWWDPVTGVVVRSARFALTSVTWSRDGRFGAGSGDAAALFHFWREADGTELCGPPADASSAPTLESLGTPGPAPEGGATTSADGGLTVTAAFVVHTHAADYYALAVADTATGTLLRQFGATIGVQPIAISRPSGDRLYTRQGPDVAVWCR